MIVELNAGSLRKALDGVPDDVPVRLSSDTGVDQGEGTIIVENASYVHYGPTKDNGRQAIEHFDIYANDVDCNEDEED